MSLAWVSQGFACYIPTESRSHGVTESRSHGVTESRIQGKVMRTGKKGCWLTMGYPHSYSISYSGCLQIELR
jgi:hypothetical protein